MTDLISIIIPVYNNSAYLDKCIGSVLMQTYKNIEVILVNDGSEDGSLSVLKKWESRDSRIKVIDKPNGGLSDARNAGMQIANGEYYSFVDSDDCINLNMIKHLLTLCKTNNVKLAGCGFLKFDCKDEITIDTIAENIIVEKIDFCKYMKKYIGCEKVKMVAAWGKLYAKELFLNMEYPVARIHEDEFITYRLMFNSQTAVFSNAEYYYYRCRNDSIMATQNAKSNYDALLAFYERDKFIRIYFPELVLEWGRWIFQVCYPYVLECVVDGFETGNALKMYRDLYKRYLRGSSNNYRKNKMLYLFPGFMKHICRIKRKMKRLRCLAD